MVKVNGIVKLGSKERIKPASVNPEVFMAYAVSMGGMEQEIL